MAREVSAGGVVIRRMAGNWQIAVIEPRRDPPPARPGKKIPSQAPVLALPKGLVDKGEKPEETAVREVREETGITGALITKLTDIRYFYVRSWGDRQRVFKIVSFYLLRYESGKIDEISTEMRQEVYRAWWMPITEAAAQLTYRSEREVVQKAQQHLASHEQEIAGATYHKQL